MYHPEWIKLPSAKPAEWTRALQRWFLKPDKLQFVNKHSADKMRQNAVYQLTPLSQFCVTNNSIWHLVRATNGSSASLPLWQCRIVPQNTWAEKESLQWPFWLTAHLPLTDSAFVWKSSWRVPRMGNFKALGIYPLTAGKGSSRQVHEGMYLEPNRAFTSEVTAVCSKAHLHWFFPASHPRKHNNPKHSVCQISGVGIRLPDPSSSWQCSAGCVGGWKINLLARKNTAGLFSTAHPCAVNRGCRNRVLGKNIKTHMDKLRVSVLPPNMSSGWSNDCQSFRAESSMALLIIIAPRWASVGYCKISTKPGRGSGTDKKNQLTFFFLLATYNSDSSVKFWHFLSSTCQSQKNTTTTTKKKPTRKPK